MTTRRAIRAITSVAVACATCAPAALAQEAYDSASPAEARAEAILAQAQAAIAEPQAGEPSRELTLALAELSQVVPALDGEERRAANRILARPDDGSGDRYGDGYERPEDPQSPACDANFCVHWVDRGGDKPPLVDGNGTSDGDGVPDYVEEVLGTADDSFAVENTSLGWVVPLGDGTRGGGTGTDKTDVYLIEFGGDFFGYSSPDEGQDGAVSKQAYLVLDNDYDEFGSIDPIDALQVTMAHEYNHVLQFAYDSLVSLRKDLWMYEASATWMENEVYPDIDDYLGYVPSFANSSRVPLTGNSPDGLKIYGAAVWNHFLAESMDPAVVRDAWADSDSVTPAHLSVAAYDSALAGAGNPFDLLGDTFIDFASASAEWRGLPGLFPDAAGQPDVKRVGDRLAVDGRARKLSLDHLAYALLKVRADAADSSDQTLRVRAPSGTHVGLDLVGRRGTPTSGDLETDTTSLDAGGTGTSVLPADSDYERITAAVVNADARVNASGRYLRDDQRVKVRLVSGP